MNLFYSWVKDARKNIHTFPILVFIAVITLSFLEISGTSIGIYESYLDGNKKDSALIAGSPQSIRSDEWLVNTQMTIAQATSGFPYISNSIGEGQNMSIIADVPYLEWSTLFKPQNWVFFVAPLGFAFAFKWWLLLATLVVSVYYLALHLFRKKILLAILSAFIFALSPFIQWWYQYITIAPLFYAIFILLTLLKIHNIESIRHKLCFGALLSWLLSCFALVLYPPFQIPCAIVVAAVYFTMLISVIRHKKKPLLKKSLIIIVGSIIASIVIIGAFLATRSTAIDSVRNTAYPGERSITSGGVSPRHLASNFIAPFFLHSQSSQKYTVNGAPVNQSEASNFIFPYIPIILCALAMIFAGIRHNKKDPLLWISTTLVLLFVARMTLPFDSFVYSLIGLSVVPNQRLLIGLGLSTFLLLLAILRNNAHIKLNRITKLSIVGLTALSYIYLALFIITANPEFIYSRAVMTVMVFGFILFSYFLLRRSRIATLLTLLILTLLSIYRIHPVYRGLDIATNTDIAQEIKKISKEHPEKKWITDNIYLENYGAMNGARSLSGTYYYPQKELFGEVDTSKDDITTDRYAHILFSLSEKSATPLVELLQPDLVRVTLNSCNKFLEDTNVGYVLSSQEITGPCLDKRLHVYKNSTNSIFLYSLKNNLQ